MSRLNKKHNIKVAAAALAGCILLAGGTGTAYAANVGGIQRTVQVWLHGDQTTANMTVSDDGTYTIEYPDENGETREISGGGIAYEADGTERPLTGEELLEEANSPDVEYNDDGTVWLYYKNQKIEITDKEVSVPTLAEWYIIPPEIKRICEHAKLTTDTTQPMRNFLLRGPAGT